jgi:hypothetical protein
MQQAFLFSGGKKEDEGKETPPKGFEKFFKKKEGAEEKKEVSKDAKKEDKK